MDEEIRRIRKPRCFMIYALAPDGMPASEANSVFNDFVSDRSLPMVIFHDHFIGRAGGLAIFYVDGPEEQDTLIGQNHLNGWYVDYRPLIFSYSPAAFDEQIAFTLRVYRGVNWEDLQRNERPAYGDPSREAETARED